MRRLTVVLCVVAAALLCVQAGTAQLETPAPSPKGKLEQKVGVMTVTVHYSRPGIKGRKIFGGLVPYGEVWRTGANEPTTVTFSDPVKVEGKALPAGTYALYTIPGESEWKVIFNKKTTGQAIRDEKEDAAVCTVKPLQSLSSIETFTINISDITTNSANLELAWEKTVVRCKMEFDVDSKVMASIKRAMENPFSSAAGMFYESASYYYNTGKDLKTALEWVNKAAELNKNAYWVWRLKSQIHAALKDYTSAIAAAETSKARAQEAGNIQFVKFNDDAIAEWKQLK